MPNWVSLTAELSALALLAWCGILPIVLLAVGLEYSRAGGPPGWRRPAAWVGAVAAGVALEVLPLRFAFAFMSGAPTWHEFAESLGYAAAGAVMILVLFGRPEPGPGRPT